MFVAHIRKSDDTVQLLKDHLIEVKELCERNGEKLGMSAVFGLAGLLHDFGKFSDDFQQYIREAVANPNHPPKRGTVDHSTAGGLLLMQRYHQPKMLRHIMVEMLANVIFSHHGQLLDYIDSEGDSPFIERSQKEAIPLAQLQQRFFEEVMSEQEFEDYVALATQQYHQFLQKHFPKRPDLPEILYKLSPFLTMMIFSSLIDADRTNSRQFDENDLSTPLDPSHRTATFEKHLHTLEQKLKNLQQQAIPNDITKLRQQMSDNCFDKATKPQGIYTLSIPTGGGKTLASLRFALKHASEHKLKRIIYVIPFTTIIEQNAAVVRDLLETDEVLEHHSNVIDDVRNPETYEELELQRQLNHAKDNWDAPIVFTTMVQFLNSMYSGKSRNLRRLHNLSDAVIIFDEVQSIPINCVSLFNEAIQFLTKYAKSTVVLCTATQPALQYVEHNITVNEEIIDDLSKIEQAFKRTNIVFMNEREQWTTEDLAEFIEDKLSEVNSVLIITNNKKTTKALYMQLNHYDNVYHLSTGMCPAHRKEKLQEMRAKLKAGEQVICVSTQLIEAGVDVSFECVMRALAGMDSIAQAAGRCNRNGESGVREVYVFKHAEEVLTKLPTIANGQQCARYILRDIEEQQIFNGEALSSDAIEAYFKQYYINMSVQLNYPVKGLVPTLHDLLFSGDRSVNQKNQVYLRTAIRETAKYFEVIEANTESILVPYGDGEKLIAQLVSGEPVDFKTFMKEAQQYSVNVFAHEFRMLQQERLIRAVDFGSFKIWIAVDSTYDDAYGLSVQGEAKLVLYDF